MKRKDAAKRPAWFLKWALEHSAPLGPCIRWPFGNKVRRTTLGRALCLETRGTPPVAAMEAVSLCGRRDCANAGHWRWGPRSDNSRKGVLHSHHRP